MKFHLLYSYHQNDYQNRIIKEILGHFLDDKTNISRYNCQDLIKLCIELGKKNKSIIINCHSSDGNTLDLGETINIDSIDVEDMLGGFWGTLGTSWRETRLKHPLEIGLLSCYAGSLREVNRIGPETSVNFYYVKNDGPLHYFVALGVVKDLFLKERMSVFSEHEALSNNYTFALKMLESIKNNRRPIDKKREEDIWKKEIIDLENRAREEMIKRYPEQSQKILSCFDNSSFSESLF